jgi:hypothetical protein
MTSGIQNLKRKKIVLKTQSINVFRENRGSAIIMQ